MIPGLPWVAPAPIIARALESLAEPPAGFEPTITAFQRAESWTPRRRGNGEQKEPSMPWTDEDVTAFAAMCARLGIEPRVLVKAICNESGCNPAAHNPGGAVGLIQLEPDNLRAMGWKAGSDAFARLSVAEQLPYIERYFGWFRKQLAGLGGEIGAVYAAMFLPVGISHGADPTYKLCGVEGPLAWAYSANKAFDTNGKGWITISDLSWAAQHAYERCSTGQAIVAALDRLDAAPDTEPATPEA